MRPVDSWKSAEAAPTPRRSGPCAVPSPLWPWHDAQPTRKRRRPRSMFPPPASRRPGRSVAPAVCRPIASEPAASTPASDASTRRRDIPIAPSSPDDEDRREQADPHHIDEVPVVPDRVDDRRPPRDWSGPRGDRERDEHQQQPGRDVQGVKPRHEVVDRPVRVGRDLEVERVELPDLIGEEQHTEPERQQQPADHVGAIAAFERADGEHHRPARRDQEHREDPREERLELHARRRPLARLRLQGEVGREQPAEEHELGGEPHDRTDGQHRRLLPGSRLGRHTVRRHGRQVGTCSKVAVASSGFAAPVGKAAVAAAPGYLGPVSALVAPSAPSWDVLLTDWSLEVTLPFVVLAAAAYVLGVRRLHARGRSWPATRTAAFLSGLVVVLGAPITLALQAGSRTTQRSILRLLRIVPVRVLTHPLTAWLLFGTSIVTLYFTPLYELSLRNEWFHVATHAYFVGAGCLFLAHVVGLDPIPHAFGYGARLLYVVVLLPFHTFVGVALLTMNTVIAAGWYDQVERTWGPRPLADQRTGAGVLWVAGELFGLLCIGIVVYQWMSAEERAAARHDRRLDAAEALEAAASQGDR